MNVFAPSQCPTRHRCRQAIVERPSGVTGGWLVACEKAARERTRHQTASGAGEPGLRRYARSRRDLTLTCRASAACPTLQGIRDDDRCYEGGQQRETQRSPRRSRKRRCEPPDGRFAPRSPPAGSTASVRRVLLPASLAVELLRVVRWPRAGSSWNRPTPLDSRAAVGRQLPLAPRRPASEDARWGIVCARSRRARRRTATLGRRGL